jgi:DNA-binding transcriptional ArsR family regulator
VLVDDQDRLFKALSEPARRILLDRLYENNGQTLNDLCTEMGMSRQAVTQHLQVLESVGLVEVMRRGREKLHFLNPVPLHEIYQRWIRKFEMNRLQMLATLKHNLERDNDG